MRFINKPAQRSLEQNQTNTDHNISRTGFKATLTRYLGSFFIKD